jgi:hypothetical protein
MQSVLSCALILSLHIQLRLLTDLSLPCFPTENIIIYLMLPTISASLICSPWWYLVNITIQRDIISISKSSIGAKPLSRVPSTVLRHFHFCPVTLDHCIIHAEYQKFPAVLYIFKVPEWPIQNEMKIKGHESAIIAWTKLHQKKDQVRMINTMATSYARN